MSEFRQQLGKLINRHSMENGSGTPDFILAEYLTDCLAAFDKAVTAREGWYGRAPTAELGGHAGRSSDGSPAAPGVEPRFSPDHLRRGRLQR